MVNIKQQQYRPERPHYDESVRAVCIGSYDSFVRDVYRLIACLFAAIWKASR